MSAPKYLFLDIETTGLDVEYDLILEIACVATDAEFNEQWREHAVFYAPPEIREHVNPIVQKMHDANGLWKECADVKGDPCLRFDMPRGMILAGSSVHFDRKFVEHDMPGLLDTCSHRHFDLTSLRLALAGTSAPRTPPGGGTHRAMDDVLRDIEHAKAIHQWLHRPWYRRIFG